MSWTGKIIGVLSGFLIAGPMGSLIGLFIGHAFDQGWIRKFLRPAAFVYSSTRPPNGLLFNAMFQVMGYVAKSDGRVSEREVQQARRVMEHMGLNEHMKQEAIRLFTEGKQEDFDLRTTLLRLKEACRFQPILLRTFLEAQFEIARADSPVISARTQAVLQEIAALLGAGYSGYSAGNAGQEQYYSHSHTPTDISLQEAYRILGVSPSADDQTVKKAYRRLMSQNHPDKLIAKGATPEQIKKATQDTQQIKQAYERIQKIRA